jgi:Protein of unknown function (DUF3168)
MTLEEALKAQLATYPGLNALIGSRVYAMGLSETAILPAVTFQRISSVAVNHRGPNVPKLGRVRFQVDGWSTTYHEAVSLRAQIRGALTHWQKTAAPRVDITLLQDDRDLNDPATDRFRASLDFMLIAEES